MGLRVFCVWICEGEDVGVWDGEGWSMTHPYVESEQNKIKNTKKRAISAPDCWTVPAAAATDRALGPGNFITSAEEWAHVRMLDTLTCKFIIN